jgi:hypothetical protein
MTSRTIQVLLCIAIIAAGCERVPPADRDAALETVRRNVRLLQEKKVDEMMTTIHPQSPAFAPTRTSITELMKLKVEGARKGDLRVRFEQITQRIKAGVAEPRTKMSGVHVLRKDGEAWKIFDTEVIAADLIDPLPEDPEPVDENVAAP